MPGLLRWFRRAVCIASIASISAADASVRAVGLEVARDGWKKRLLE
jgi:hypothetical protein